MRWDWPWIWFFLIGLPVGIWFWMRRSKPFTLVWPTVGLQNQEKAWWKGPEPHQWIVGFRVLALLCWMVALARPQLPDERSYRSVSGIDMVLALDVSRSMQARDLGDLNRLETAKITLRKFIEARSSDRMGLVMFSGEAYTLSPPTLDAGLLLQALSQARMGLLRDGTAIGDGLALAINRLRQSKAKSRVIVLLTDGDNNAGQIDPITSGELAIGYGIRVYTIAVGRQGRVVVPMEVEDAFGNKHTEMQVLENALNTELLEKIAADTKGRFYLVEDRLALDGVFKEIDQLEKAEIKTQIRVQYRDVFVLWIWLGLVLLTLSEVLRVGVWKLSW